MFFFSLDPQVTEYSTFLNILVPVEHVKGKGIPLQVWTGSRRLKLPDFKIVGT
jgi:hypothetical protein